MWRFDLVEYIEQGIKQETNNKLVRSVEIDQGIRERILPMPSMTASRACSLDEIVTLASIRISPTLLSNHLR